MLKKKLLPVLLSASLLTGFAGFEATAAIQTEQTETVEVLQEVNIQEVTPAAETAPVHESKIAKRMTQAEKAQNAAENDSRGGAITIIAMCIVLSALVILSLLFLGFGKISSAILTKKKKNAHGVDDYNKEDHHDELDSGEVIAAISMALAEHFRQDHDIEDTILTIKRMKKSYSPWNSKIYNMRQMGERHPAKR